MLPKKHRLTLLDFNQNPCRRKKVVLSTIRLSFKKSYQKISRFIIIVPKYLDKRSTKRHQTRRIIVEVIREILPEIKTPLDFLIKARKILEKKDRDLIKDDIRESILNVKYV